MSLIPVIKLALTAYVINSTQRLSHEIYEIETEIDRLGVDADDVALMRIERLNRRRKSLSESIATLRSIFSDSDRG